MSSAQLGRGLMAASMAMNRGLGLMQQFKEAEELSKYRQQQIDMDNRRAAADEAYRTAMLELAQKQYDTNQQHWEAEQAWRKQVYGDERSDVLKAQQRADMLMPLEIEKARIGIAADKQNMQLGEERIRAARLQTASAQNKFDMDKQDNAAFAGAPAPYGVPENLWSSLGSNEMRGKVADWYRSGKQAEAYGQQVQEQTKNGAWNRWGKMLKAVTPPAPKPPSLNDQTDLIYDIESSLRRKMDASQNAEEKAAIQAQIDDLNRRRSALLPPYAPSAGGIRVSDPEAQSSLNAGLAKFKSMQGNLYHPQGF
jgi:hypothetical protein